MTGPRDIEAAYVEGYDEGLKEIACIVMAHHQELLRYFESKQIVSKEQIQDWNYK